METPFSAGHSASLPDSLWAATTRPLPRYPELSGELSTDVTVIGAGFMGLAAALSLAENGANVVVIEAAEIGWGASGRNNGLLAPGLKRDPQEVRKILGHDAADRLLIFSGDSLDIIAELAERHDINCDLRRTGWIQAAHATRALPLLEQRVRQWQELGADTEMIEPGKLHARLGTNYYAGASFDPRGGSLNPLAFARGLALAAQQAGARFFERTPAINIEHAGGRWLVTVPGGLIQSDNVVCCTNAYNLDVDAMRGVVIPLRTAQVASTPLSEDQARRILPGGESASDTQRLLTSFRLTADDRLIMGGASATAGDEHAGLFSCLHRSAQLRFPDLGKISWEYGWSGYLALTQDHLPKIYKRGNGFWAGIGCNGRGIGMATGIGQLIAGLLSGQPENDCAVPIAVPSRIRGFGLRRPGVAAAVVLNRVFDVAERRLGGGS